MHKFGPTQKKILLVLAGGVALGLSSTPRQYFRTFRKLRREWGKISQGNFDRSIQKLSDEKLIEEKILSDGSFKLILTEKGKRQAGKFRWLNKDIKLIKPKRWDKKWRIVIFDIPEKDKAFRNILRKHLYVLEFVKLQNSVFVSPYPFEKPILDLISLYKAEAYVRVITAEKIDNESKLKKHFSKLYT